MASALAQRLRLPLGFVLAAAYLVFARATPLTLAVGCTIALVGVLTRAWAAGHIIKKKRLATGGPYAYTRNPLYLGSFLIAAGFAVAAHWSLLLLVTAFFALVYAPTMQREKEKIRTLFPGTFPDYERNVPAFLPRPTPWRSTHPEEESRFSLRLYMQHGEWRTALGFLAVMLWLLVRMRGWP